MRNSSKVQPQPYRMHNQIQHYAWGARGASALIPRLLDIEPEPDTPYAELWIGAHPKAPSEIELPDGTRMPLNKWIAAHPEMTLGIEVMAQYGELPFLFKVLSAGQALSIQAHPTKEQAEALHARDPEHYPDDNHKPEIAVALDGLTALVGFRPFSELVDTLQQYPELARFAGPSIVDQLLQAQAPSSALQRSLTYDLFATLVQRAGDDPQALQAAVDTLAARLAPRQDPSERERRFLLLREQYGSNDIGLFAFFLFNMIHLEPGEAIYTDAGVPHAYLGGNIIECMANSDNVVRVGLTPKFKDAETLLRIVNPTPQAPEILDGGPVNVGTGIIQAHYATPTPEFEITRWQLETGAVYDIEKGSIPAVLLVIDGDVELAWGEAASTHASFRRGESAFLPASLTRYHIRARSSAELVQASVPQIQ